MEKQFIPCRSAEVSLRLDARVCTRDGKPIGFVHWVVVDPSPLAVTGFVVAEPGLLARQVLVPTGDVEAATPDGEVVQLRLSRQNLDALPDHAADDYVPPPPTWSDVLRLGLGTSAYLGGARGATPGRAALCKGDVILDRAGQRLGSASAVCLDPSSGRLVAIVASSAGGRHSSQSAGDAWKLPADWVEDLGEGRARLRVDHEAVERCAERARLP
jgi:uncharacterized protein YrrD